MTRESAPGINRAAWLRALDESRPAPANDPDLLTVAELADVFGCSHLSAWRRVQKLLKAGKAVEGMKLVQRRSGGVHPTVAYRLTTEP